MSEAPAAPTGVAAAGIPPLAEANITIAEAGAAAPSTTPGAAPRAAPGAGVSTGETRTLAVPAAAALTEKAAAPTEATSHDNAAPTRPARSVPMSRVSIPTVPRMALMERLYAQLRRLPESKTLAHLVRFLGTWSGSDKYGTGLIVALLLAWQRLRARRGRSALVESLRAINGLTADARILFRIWALLPMVQWMIGLERAPPPTRNLQFIERLQALSMVVYSPMEAVAYLAMHKILPVTDAVQNWLWLYGCRLWAAYVVLDFWHIIEDHRVLRSNARALEQSRGHPGPTESEKGMSDEQRETRRLWAGLRERKNMLLTQFWVNVGYLPLTVHWSVEGGLLTEGWVGFFGTIAAFASTLLQWKATA